MNDTVNDFPSEDAAPIKLAATILLLRDGADGLEVFMVVRHQKIDFASGALVFPGGKLAPGDSEADVAAACDGVDGLNTDHIALRVGAIREAFEECGVLLAREKGGTSNVSAARLERLGPAYRQPLDRGEVGIGEMLVQEELRLACDQLTHFAHWVTPSFMPKRFDTHFYLAKADGQQVLSHDGREAVDSLWIRPQDVLDKADAGEVVLVPATRSNVEKLAQSQSADEAIRRAQSSPVVRIEPRVEKRDDGVWLTIPAEAGYPINEFRAPGKA